MEPKIQCVCGHEKSHNQVCWIRVELEVPQGSESSAIWKSNTHARELPICRKCLMQHLRKGADRKTEGVKGILNLAGRKRRITETTEDPSEKAVMDAVCDIAKRFPVPQF